MQEQDNSKWLDINVTGVQTLQWHKSKLSSWLTQPKLNPLIKPLQGHGPHFLPPHVRHMQHWQPGLINRLGSRLFFSSFFSPSSLICHSRHLRGWYRKAWALDVCALRHGDQANKGEAPWISTLTTPVRELYQILGTIANWRLSYKNVCLLWCRRD